MYGGDDKKPSSGRLELRRHDGSESYLAEGFLMENTEQGWAPTESNLCKRRGEGVERERGRG